MEKDTNLKKLLEAVARETKLFVVLQQSFDRGPRPYWTVLMGRMFNPPRPGLHRDAVRSRLTLKEALEFLRGFRLGFQLGARNVYHGPEAIRLFTGDDYEPIPEKD